MRKNNADKYHAYVNARDKAGNILTKKTYALTAAKATPSTLYGTDTYTYGDSSWGDKLTKYNGTSLSYDAIGNPTTYYNGSTFTLNWKNGRQLSYTRFTANELYYSYNDEGIRVSKTVNGTKHSYHLSGTQIVYEEWGNNLCVYIYDENGSPMGMQYRTSSMAENTFYTFWFEKNLQGDIIAVYNESGTKLITYTYDAWGNVAEAILNHSGNNLYATYNPFRYRGYYYDTESQLYYLQSRYYSPEMGRFINADGQLNGGLLGYNQFAYCENDPIDQYDPTGRIAGFILDNDEIVLQMLGKLVVLQQSTEDILYRLGSYSELRELARNTDYEVHHLIDVRFIKMNVFPKSLNIYNGPSVILPKGEHYSFTRDSRIALPYGHEYSLGEITNFLIEEYGGSRNSWLVFLMSSFN